MNVQEEAFLQSEGDAWHQRNQRREAESEERWFTLLSDIWERLPLREGNRILEIGCGSGRNLAFLRQKYGGGRVLWLGSIAESGGGRKKQIS